MGEAVLHQPKSGGSYARSGIYSEQFKSIDAHGLDVITDQPNLGIRLADWMPAIKQEDVLVIRGVIYWARHLVPDGDGGGTWLLDKKTGISGNDGPKQFEPSQFSGDYQ